MGSPWTLPWSLPWEFPRKAFVSVRLFVERYAGGTCRGDTLAVGSGGKFWTHGACREHTDSRGTRALAVPWPMSTRVDLLAVV